MVVVKHVTFMVVNVPVLVTGVTILPQTVVLFLDVHQVVPQKYIQLQSIPAVIVVQVLVLLVTHTEITPNILIVQLMVKDILVHAVEEHVQHVPRVI